MEIQLLVLYVILKGGRFKRKYKDTFDCQILDVTDVPAIHKVVDEAFKSMER